MGSTPGKGTDLKLTISATPTTIAQLRRITPLNDEMGTVETTDITSTWRTFIATVNDGGSVTFTVRLDFGETTHAQLRTSKAAGTLETWLVTLADSGAATIGFTAIITNLAISELAVDNIAELDVTLKISSTVTITP